MMMSAFWHGFYPGYYVMFFFFGIINEITKDVYRAWPLFVDVPYHLKTVVCFLVTQIGMNYFGITFICLTTQNVLTFFRVTNYFGIIILFIMFFCTRVLGLLKMAIAKKTETGQVNGTKKTN
jgi:hypothetical protein